MNGLRAICPPYHRTPDHGKSCVQTWIWGAAWGGERLLSKAKFRFFWKIKWDKMLCRGKTLEYWVSFDLLGLIRPFDNCLSAMLWVCTKHDRLRLFDCQKSSILHCIVSYILHFRQAALLCLTDTSQFYSQYNGDLRRRLTFDGHFYDSMASPYYLHTMEGKPYP